VNSTDLVSTVAAVSLTKGSVDCPVGVGVGVGVGGER
jgi:hypothetical protein